MACARSLTTYAVLLAALAVSTCYCDKVIIKNDAIKGNFNNGELVSTTALFGLVPYGKDVSGYLVIADPEDACSQIAQKNNSDYSIIVAFRGQCAFTTKSMNAEQFNARAIIIVDNIIEATEKNAYISNNPFYQGHIPVVFVNKLDGDKLVNKIKEELAKNNETRFLATLQFDEPPKTAIAQLDYYFNSLQSRSYDFFQALLAINSKLENKYNVHFHPYLENKYYDVSVQKEQCIYQKYCTLDPDGDGPLTGKQALQFNLRLKCAEEVIGNRDSFLRFAISFGRKCVDIPLIVNEENALIGGLEQCFFNQYNSGYTLHSVMWDEFRSRVRACEDDSEAITDQLRRDNVWFRDEFQQEQQQNVFMSPTLLVNDKIIHGDLSNFYQIGDVVCDSLQEKPDVCNQEFEIIIPDLPKADAPTASKFNAAFIIILCVLVAAGIMALLFYLYKKRLRRDMSSYIQQQVEVSISSYMQFSNNTGNNNKL